MNIFTGQGFIKHYNKRNSMPIKNKKIYNEYMRNYYRKQKQAKIKKHGGKCHICGESQIEFLNFKRGKVICWNCQFSKK